MKTCSAFSHNLPAQSEAVSQLFVHISTSERVFYKCASIGQKCDFPLVHRTRQQFAPVHLRLRGLSPFPSYLSGCAYKTRHERKQTARAIRIAFSGAIATTSASNHALELENEVQIRLSRVLNTAHKWCTILTLTSSPQRHD